MLESAGSFAWDAKWGPAYHQSMIISIAAMAVAIFLAFGKLILKVF